MVINRLDAERLYKLFDNLKDNSLVDLVEMLEDKLSNSNIVEPQDMPADYITMNSKIKLTELDSGKELIRTLVYPHSLSEIDDGLSVMAPTGAAVLGKKKNDLVEVSLANGRKVKLQVNEILWQPESMKQYYK